MKTNNTCKLLLLSLISSISMLAQTPNWAWSKSVDGDNYQKNTGIKTDITGNVYVSGWFSSNSITIEGQTLYNYNGGNRDFYIIKYSSAGNVLWAISGGGANDEHVHSLSIDSVGNVVIVGDYFSPTLPLGTITLTNSPGTIQSDMFIAKYTPSGTLLWAKSAGGGYYSDIANSVVCDDHGNSYITGGFASQSVSFGSNSLSNWNSTGNTQCFIVKYDYNGNVVWAKRPYGTIGNAGFCTSTDGNNVYVSGRYYGSFLDFDGVTLNSGDAFVAKIDQSGNTTWVKNFLTVGGITSIDTDNAGNLVMTGDFTSSSISLGGTTLSNSYSSTSDIFLAKLNTLSGGVMWAKSIGGTNNANSRGVCADGLGNIYVTGDFERLITFTTNLSLTNNNTWSGSGSRDAFVAKYTSNGIPVWAKGITGNEEENATAITTDYQDNVYTTGTFRTDSVLFDGIKLLKTGSFGNSYTAKIGTNVATDIVNVSNTTNDIVIYPNPFTNELKIEANSPSMYSITNALGQTIIHKKMNSNFDVIDTRSMAEGVYYIELIYENLKVVKKIVKQ